MRFYLPLIAVAILFASALVFSAEPAYRTDNGKEQLPWFQLRAGEFPPEGSAHYIAGELIAVDHVNRKGVLRQDRDHSQRTDEYDRPLPFTLLPYGSLGFHGAPAELRDIPIGTHLHGKFYFEEKGGKNGAGAFTKALRLEDDFTFSIQQQRLWRIDALALDKGTITATSVSLEANQAAVPLTEFQITPATRIWKGRAVGTLADLTVGQSVLLNLTLCTLKGPGRCTDIWLDVESRQLASHLQIQNHHQYLREHGIAAVIDEVDNQQGIVVATLFAGFDPTLKAEFPANDYIGAAVAEESLRTYDQAGDFMQGPILEVQSVPVVPGNSGMRIKFKPERLLEGYRPKRIVRLFSSRWRVDELPREERLYE